MPELPEVETTARGLRSKVVGHTITDFWCDHARMIRYISIPALRKLVVGRKVVIARRRAKHVLIDLSGGKTLVIHMKMTGHLLYGKYSKITNPKAQNSTKSQIWKAQGEGPLRDDPYNRFVHAIFVLDSPTSPRLRGARLCLAFSDMRKFGKIAIHDTHNIHTAKELEGLGPELWEIKAREFVKLMQSKKGRIKQVLMDQLTPAGVGNIYSDEALYLAGIHPLSQTNKLTNDKLLKLFRALVSVTKKSFKTGGDSMSDYRNIDGVGGKFQNYHKVYGRKGLPCRKLNCKGMIERIIVAGRSAHFCPKHQKLYASN